MIAHFTAAARSLRRAPGYAALVVGLLGLGLGTLAAAWAVLNQVVLRSLPVAEQDNLIVAWTHHLVRGFDHYPVIPELFEAVEAGGAPALQGAAAVGSYGAGQRAVEGPDGPQPLAWASVLGDFFGVLGVEPVLGRALSSADDVPSPTERVAVISHGLWQRRFGGSAEVLGEVLRTRTGSYAVVGVMPPDFDYPQGTEVWGPTRPGYPEWDQERPRLELDLVGRLASGAGPEAVVQQLTSLTGSTPSLSEVYQGTVPVVRGYADVVVGELGSTLRVLFLGGLLVLGVAVLAAANLTLVRSVDRDGETAVRRALGADLPWLRREAWAEASLLGAGAWVLGALLGTAGVHFLVPMAPAGLARLEGVGGLEPTVLLWIAGVAALAAGVAVGAPRAFVDRRSAGSTLHRGVRGTPSSAATWLREGVVCTQVALAVWVLVTGGLLVRTVANLQALEAGFDPDALALVTLDHRDGGVLGSREEADGLRAVTEVLESDPDIQVATPVQMPPLPGNGAWQSLLYKEGQNPEEAARENAYLFMEFVEPDFVAVLDVPVLRGRPFDPSEGPDDPIALMVNQSAARLYWPGEDPVGQTVTTGLPGADSTSLTVVGVVGDTRYGELTELKPTVYFPLAQIASFQSRFLLIRTTGAPSAVFDRAREALVAEGGPYRALSVSTVRDRLDAPLARPRFAATLLTVLAVVALFIAVTGIYATMAFLVRTRRRELGVRMACGGSPQAVGGQVLGRGLVIAAAGDTVGDVATAFSGRLFETLLFEVSPGDPATLLAGVGVAVVCAALACLVPALRAAATDPAEVLRAD